MPANDVFGIFSAHSFIIKVSGAYLQCNLWDLVLHTELCTFLNHVQSIQFTTNRLQSSSSHNYKVIKPRSEPHHSWEYGTTASLSTFCDVSCSFVLNLQSKQFHQFILKVKSMLLRFFFSLYIHHQNISSQLLTSNHLKFVTLHWCYVLLVLEENLYLLSFLWRCLERYIRL